MQELLVLNPGHCGFRMDGKSYFMRPYSITIVDWARQALEPDGDYDEDRYRWCQDHAVNEGIVFG